MHPITRGRRRLVLAGCGIATLAMLASATIVSVRAGASWSAMEEQKEQLRRKFNARTQKREPLWGDVIKGAAFSHYGHALATAKPLSKQLPPPAKLFAISDEQLATVVEPFRARWAP